jgi:hypothetical protein
MHRCGRHEAPFPPFCASPIARCQPVLPRTGNDKASISYHHGVPVRWTLAFVNVTRLALSAVVSCIIGLPRRQTTGSPSSSVCLLKLLVSALGARAAHKPLTAVCSLLATKRAPPDGPSCRIARSQAAAPSARALLRFRAGFVASVCWYLPANILNLSHPSKTYHAECGAGAKSSHQEPCLQTLRARRPTWRMVS